MIDYPLPSQFPHQHANSVMRMGMSVIPAHQWLEPCVDLAPFHNHKQAVYQERGEHVFAALEQSVPAQRELASTLSQHLTHDHHQVYQGMHQQLLHLPSGMALSVPKSADTDSLWQASLWVADDLLLMQKTDQQYCLTAASLCSPSSWHLQEKLGRPMTRIHDPVPQIHTQLTPKIDRFLDGMIEGQVVQRFNWSLQNAQQLTELPENSTMAPRDIKPAPLDPDAPVFYRMERQSLRRLPQTQAIVFGIRIYIYELSQMAKIPSALSSLKAAIDTMPDDMQAYKNMAYFKSALTKYWA